MAIAIIRCPSLIIASSGWLHSFNFMIGALPRSAVAADLTGCSAIATLTPESATGVAAYVMSTGNGMITIHGGSVVVDAPGGAGAGELGAWAAGWAPGDCDFRLRIIDPTLDVDRYVVITDPLNGRIQVLP